MAFNQAYSNLLAKLPAFLINEAWIRLTSRKRNPLSEIEDDEVNPIVESFLKHEVIRYQKRLMCQRRTQSWPEYPASLSFKELPVVHLWIMESTDNITCDHEEENNRRVMNEFNVFRQHLLDYNKNTFEKFMRDVEEEYRERINVNKKLRREIEDLKMQVYEAEKNLVSMKSDSIH